MCFDMSFIDGLIKKMRVYLEGEGCARYLSYLYIDIATLRFTILELIISDGHIHRPLMWAVLYPLHH
jgi:hypothetical protein